MFQFHNISKSNNRVSDLSHLNHQAVTCCQRLKLKHEPVQSPTATPNSSCDPHTHTHTQCDMLVTATVITHTHTSAIIVIILPVVYFDRALIHVSEHSHFMCSLKVSAD